MMTLNEIKQALQDRRVNKVAAATGLHYNTIRSVRDGKSNPSASTMAALSDYLTRADAA